MSEELKTAIGVLQDWKDKPTGWTDFQILFTGRQHPTKISTNDQQLVAAVKALGQNVGTYTFAESDGNINPRTNTPFINRYLREVAPGANESAVTQPTQQNATAGSATPPTAGGSSPAQPQEEWVPPPRYSEEEVARFESKERRDYRSRSWAHTIAAFNHTIKVDEDPTAVYERLKPFHDKVYENICGMFAYADDDIPF